MNIRTSFYFFIVIAFLSCTVPFVPNVQKFEELLVVDGAITNAPGPYTVTLSISSKPQQLSLFKPYRGCKLMIEDNFGNKTALLEHAPGVYQTDSSALRGVTGRAYTLTIASANGDLYESTPEVIQKEAAIKSVYGELSHKNKINGFDGYQFYVDSETPEGKENCLFWRLECTYKFQSDYKMCCYYDNGLLPVEDEDTLRNCYRTVKIPNLYLLNPNEQITTVIKRVALNYEGNLTKALMIRYSLKVSQLTIGKKAFNYWTVIKKIQDSGGELFTQQPYQVKNNLTNRSHPEKPVLGYFMAAGVSEERIFLNRPPILFHLDICPPYDLGPKCDFQCMLNKFQRNPSYWPVFLAKLPANAVRWVPSECIDCRETGFQKKPSFWKD